MKAYNPKTSSVKKASSTNNPQKTHYVLKPDINSKQVIHNPHCDFKHGKHLSVAAENEKKKALVSENKREDLKELKIKDNALEIERENFKVSKEKDISPYIKKETLKEFEFKLGEDFSLKTNVNLSDTASKSYDRILEEEIECINQYHLYWTSSFMDL